MRKKRRLKKSLTNFLTFCVTLIICFLFLNWTANSLYPLNYKKNNVLTGWDLPPNLDIKLIQKDVCNNLSREVHVKTNNLSFRSFSPPLKNKTRILVVGDSFTQGIHVSNGEEYYSYLETDNIQVFAKGVSGWSTLQEFITINHTYELIKPDIIIIQFCENDFYSNDYDFEKNTKSHNDGYYRPYLEEEKIVYKNSLIKKNKIQEMLNQFRLFKILNFNFNILITKLTDNNKGSEFDKFVLQKEDYIYFKKSINKTDNILQMIKNNFSDSKIIMFYVDTSDKPPVVFEKYFNNLTKKNKIRTLDIQEKLNNISKDHCIFSDRVGGHWNQKGHEIVGKYILNFLKTNGYIKQ